MNKIKGFISNEITAMKKELNIFEYILWWVLRIAMAAGMIYKQNENGPGFSLTVLILGLNLLATFTVPLIRLLLFPKKAVCRLPFSCQRWINVIVFFAAFLGHTFSLVHEVTSWDKLMHIMSGAVVLLLGNELTKVFIREKDKVSDSFRILTATGFSFFAMVIWEIYEFIVDYNWPESTNMAYNCNPDRDPFFVWLYGGPSSNFEAGLSAVFDTVTDMICAVAGAIPVIILLALSLKRKRKNTESGKTEKSKVSYGGIMGFFKSELTALRSSVTLAEYVFWWVLRIGQTVMLIYRYKFNGPGSVTVLIMTLNLIATFAIPLIRIILPFKKAVTQIPFRVQSWINFIVFFASFLGHGFNFSYSVTSWDKILHIMMGVVAFFIGNELIKPFIRKDDRVSPLLSTLHATGFSYMAIVLWEIYEFIIDYNWPESGNMAYRMPENDPTVQDPFFVWLYGGPSVNFDAGLISLFDTLTDMICAVIGIIPCMVILYLILRSKEKKALTEKEKVNA